MMKFPKTSAFAQEEERLSAQATIVHTQVEDIGLERVARPHDDKPPLEHWHHDLESIDILLDQDPPDVDRARRLVQEVRDEMYRHLR